MITDLFDIYLVKNGAFYIGLIISVFSFYKGIAEYSRQGIQKRADYFFELRNRFLQDATIMKICLLCEKNDPDLKEIPLSDKLKFLGFFDEVALSLNSRLISKNVAHYMFGYYSLRSWESGNFWVDMEKEDDYWATLSSLIDKMYIVENGIKIKKYIYKLNIIDALKLYKKNLCIYVKIAKNRFIYKKLKL